MFASYQPEYTLGNWGPDRGYDLFLPSQSKRGRALPLVIAIHGYTHDGRKMRNLTSPTGKPEHPNSLDSLAEREGFVVAYPNGTSIPLFPGRCWNAGGGLNGFAPVGDPAQREGVDDLQYFLDLLSDIADKFSVDLERVYLLGISNGGAMAHRLAVVFPERWAAIASVAGCNQYSAASGAKPEVSVPTLVIHGTQDPVWAYGGGPFGQAGLMVSVQETLDMWVEANRAKLVSETLVAKGDPEDKCEVFLSQYRGDNKRSDIDFHKIVGGGHAWPGGQKYLPKAVIGYTTNKLNANKVVWDFFREHVLD